MTLEVHGARYLRVIRQKSLWGDDLRHTLAERVEMFCASTIESIRESNSAISFFRVTQDIDLERTIVAFKARSEFPVGEVSFILFPESLFLPIASSHVRVTPGDTPCPWVNSLHLDLAPVHQVIRELARAAIVNGVTAERWKKNQVRHAKRHQGELGCLVGDPAPLSCMVADCPH